MVIKSLSPADRYERAVAFYINTFPNVLADRPKVGTSYSDVYVEYHGASSWIEVKMNDTDQMGNPRVSFNGERWVATKMGPVQTFVCDRLNRSDSTSYLVERLRQLSGRRSIVIPTTKGGLSHPKAVSRDIMREYLEDEETAYIYDEPDVDLGRLITDHYNWGKAEPAHYISAGDHFYQLGEQNPLRLDAPILRGRGALRVRIGMRSEFYEIQPEIKIRNMDPSPYSIAPGTNKPHPFDSSEYHRIMRTTSSS